MDDPTREDMRKVAKACSWLLLNYMNRGKNAEYATLNELSALSDLRSALAALQREAEASNIGTAV